jgi:hypothetical protein
MLIDMRTTLVLDDRVLKLARRRAVERGLTLSEVVNEALRSMLAAQASPRTPPFRMVTFGEPSLAADHEPSDFADATEAEDREARKR